MTSERRTRWWQLAPWIGLVMMAALFAGCRDGDDGQSEWDDIEEVTRVVIAASEPAESPAQVLELTRVIIPAGLQIAPHTHPGTQMAMIAEGVLTYTVLTGEVEVTRFAGTADERVDVVRAGETTEITSGDSLVEVPGMAHEAANLGETPVVIYLSSLFETGAPASSPYEGGE